MKKTFVLDTNVLLQTPYSLYTFGDNIVVLPEAVLEELDKFKKDKSELGANARKTGKILDDLRKTGNLKDGVITENGGIIRVEMNFKNVELPKSWKDSNDNRILQVCLGLKELGENVFLVTKDVFERIKADVVGIVAQDFHAEQVPSVDDQYKGRRIVYADDDKVNRFYTNGYLETNDVYDYNEITTNYEKVQLELNEFLVIKSSSNSKKTALGRYNGMNIVPLVFLNERPFGVVARNAGQKFMQEALMLDSSIAPLVIIKGPAGTAKTFYSLAVGLHNIIGSSSKEYRKILVLRPNVKLDEDIGFLPGTEKEKMSPFLRPVIDNLEILIDSDENERYKSEKELKDKIDELFDRNIIDSEAIAYIRGRSISKQWVIIDEAQNLTPRQVKGITTRAGKGSKIVLIGDPDQIDHPFLDSRTNGLSYASEKMKGAKLCYQVTMLEDEGERSDLATECAKRMFT